MTVNSIGVLTGKADASKDPDLTANAERGRVLVETVSTRIADRAAALLAEATATGRQRGT